ncbi:MAG: hypothetical protein IKW98_04015 [Prevotella sp.]|nr:hypothetical protein [Prevotella sp.]
MKNTVYKNKKATLLAVCVFLSSFLSVMADGVQESLNLDYFRTPEATAFKIYGEESVNEYTGTANISIPLYTIKCKDIEIPIVLRYDASGIKVEQEASWVGLGWNLAVGGCINYVCAGGTDMYGVRDVHDSIWTEYLTSRFGPWSGNGIYGGISNGTPVTRSQIKYYNYTPNETSNWMATLPYSNSLVPPYIDQFKGQGGMKDYVDWGFGERDFYFVNVLGKSFMFFVDPFTLNIYNIGQAGEDFKVQTDPVLETRGIGRNEDIQKWIITDSEGYVYRFEQRDRLADQYRAWYFYTSCWYLTEINTPLGEKIKFLYTEHQKTCRATRSESVHLANAHVGGQGCCGNAYPNGRVDILRHATVTSHYLREIKTSNQTVTFVTSNSNECSGMRLDTITILSDTDTTIKSFAFSYDRFGYSNIGGNYAPANNETDSEYRLKLDNVKEIAFTDTLTTSFSYNTLDLPSKRSCAQDFWGYFNGRNNHVSGIGYTMIPIPQSFMSLNYTQGVSIYSIGGANRYSRGHYMQAAMLNRMDYPTGGYTTYEYESNSILTRDFTLSDKYREKQYDISVHAGFYVSSTPYGLDVNQDDQVQSFALSQEATFDLILQCSGSSQLYGQNMHIQINKHNTGLIEDISVAFPSSSEETYVQSLTLTPGQYTLILVPINNNDNLPFTINCYLNGWYEETLSETYYPLTCGGLRISKISNFDHDGNEINYTTYDYNNNGMTSGKLLKKIETIDYAHCYNFSPVGGLPGIHTVDVYTISSGHSRMPEFFVSCTPGIVGYSKVTKRKYDADDNLEKSVVTSYINNEPQTVKIDYYDCLDNGKIQSQEIRDASDAVAAIIVNTYDRQRIHYATNLVTQNKSLNTSGYETEGVVDVWRYPYILSRVELSNSVTTEYNPDGSTIVKTKDYLYNGINHQVSQIDENTGLPNQTQRTKYTYSADGIDYISRWMRDAHRLNDVVETKKLLVENGQEKCQSTQRTDYTSYYNNGTSHYLPVSLSTSIGDNAPETRVTYSYDDSLNVCSIVVDSMETVYIWSYKGHYPIAKIEGLTYAEVQSAIGTSTISNLLDKAEPTTEDLNSIRNAIELTGGHVTTYTYEPLVGIVSQTLPNGYTIHYNYDCFGRLSSIIDHNGSVVSTNSYNYKKP